MGEDRLKNVLRRLFWSSLGRRRVAARRCMVGLEEPVEIVEERPLYDGLP